MDRGVQKVRESIKQRKRERDRTKLKWNNRKTLPFSATDEEKHGFFDVPAYDISSSIKKNERKTFPVHLIKAVGSIALFFFVAVLMQTNLPGLKQTKEWTYEALHEEFPFAKVNEWYVSRFGSPLSFTPQGTIQHADEESAMALPVLGHVVETFAVNGTGIMISPEEKTVVSTISNGVVIFAGNDRNTHKTVIVQHADGSKTTYGYLSSIDVHIYQTVSANQTIGTFQPTEKSELVYFSIEKDKEFIDPSQVIKVDDIP